MSDLSGNAIIKYDPNGVASVFASSSGINWPTGLSFDKAGDLYVVNNVPPTETIEKFSPNGVHTTFASTGLSSATGLAFDSAGNLYAANGGSKSIEKYTPTGAASLFPHVLEPEGIAFDSAGNLYAARYDYNAVDKITPDGTVTTFVTTGLNHPYGVTFDGASNLYVGNVGNNTIVKFTPDGTASTFASTGINNLGFLRFGPAFPGSTPEPGAFALLVSLGIVGIGLLRRQRCASFLSQKVANK